jgi:hypothetical protein
MEPDLLPKTGGCINRVRRIGLTRRLFSLESDWSVIRCVLSGRCGSVS